MQFVLPTEFFSIFQGTTVGPKKEKSWGKQTASWRTRKSQICAQMDFDTVLPITRYEIKLTLAKK